MPETAANVAHLIDHLLRAPCLKPTWRLRVIDYVRAGYNEHGQRIQRSVELDEHMKTLECEECDRHPCPEECPVKAFHDLIYGDAVLSGPVMFE